MADPTDTVQTVVDALKGTIAAPASSGAGTNPGDWQTGPATPGPLIAPIATLMGVLYGASPDMQTTGKSIADGLNEVIVVIRAIASQMTTLTAGAADGMQALQNALTLAHTLSPTGPAVVLDSASGLFGQISQLLADPTKGAIALYQLAQQLDLIRQKVAYPQS
jgi:hypothetical protein